MTPRVTHADYAIYYDGQCLIAAEYQRPANVARGVRFHFSKLLNAMHKNEMRQLTAEFR